MPYDDYNTPGTGYTSSGGENWVDPSIEAARLAREAAQKAYTEKQFMSRDDFLKKYGDVFVANDRGGNAASEVAGMSVADYYDKYLDPKANASSAGMGWGDGYRYRDQNPNFNAWDNVNPHPESQDLGGLGEAWRTLGRPAAMAASMYAGVNALGGALGGTAGGASTGVGPAASAGGSAPFSFGVPEQIATGIDLGAVPAAAGGLPAAAGAGLTSLAPEALTADAWAAMNTADAAALSGIGTEATAAGAGAWSAPTAGPGSAGWGMDLGKEAVGSPSLWDSTKAALTKQYVNADGSFKIADILKDGLTVAAVIKKLSEGPEVKNGTYNVQVPDRTMVGHTPIATPAGHVPGSGGVSWFTPHSFVNSGDTAALSAAQAKDAKRVAGLGALNAKNTDTYKSNLAAQSLTAPYTVPVYRNPLTDEDYMNTWNAAAGGMAPQQGAPMAPQQPLPARYLQGATDGMADQIPAVIDGKQPAAMAHGEFVVPADVVSHLGNGNSDAGAQHLYKMMDDIRTARTGTKKQGKQINPETFTAKAGGLAKAANYAKGGAVQHFATGGDLATGAASNITAVANNPALWQPYGGQLTAGTSALQQKAFDAYGNLGASGTVGGGGAAAGTATSQGYTAAQSTAQQAEAAQAQAINAGPAAQYIATQATPAQQAAAQGYNVNTASATNVAPTQGYQSSLAGSQGYTANLLGAAERATARDATSQGYNATLAGAAPTVEKTTLGAAPTSNYQANLNSYQMAGPEKVNTDRFIDNGNSTAYMTPYMQQVVENQQRDAQRQADVATTQRQSNQMKQGAFGGSRTAVMDAEAAKNLAAQKGDIQAAGLQSAYTNAQAQYNADQARGVGAQAANQQAGIQTGTANLGANLQTQGLGTQVGLQQSLANQNLQGQYGLAQGQMDNAGNMQNAQLASQTNLTNAGFQNQAGQFTANAANTANLQNAQQSNQVGMFNSGQQNQFSLANQAAQNEAAKFGANASNQAGIANAGLQSAASQFGANANNTAGLANAAAANQVGIANAGFQNQAGQFVANANNTVNATNAGFQQQANISNAGAINNATQFNAGSVNQNTLANAGFQNNAAISNAGFQNSTNNNNAQLGTQTNLANTAATNQASQFTANAGNAASIANAGNQTQASVSSANNGTSAAIANQNYGLAAINATLNAGGVQQNTTQAGLNADYANWLAARDAPKAAATYGLTALPALNYAVQP